MPTTATSFWVNMSENREGGGSTRHLQVSACSHGPQRLRQILSTLLGLPSTGRLLSPQQGLLAFNCCIANDHKLLRLPQNPFIHSHLRSQASGHSCSGSHKVTIQLSGELHPRLDRGVFSQADVVVE